MLLNFTVKNWKSIKDEASFSMQATREQQHGGRLTQSNKFGFRILPNAVLFGPNASGKTNFVTAFEFIKYFVIAWEERFLGRHLKPHKLDQNLEDIPSEFSLELLLDGYIYEYQISCTSKEVRTEKLIKSNSNSEYILFNRTYQNYEFDDSQISIEDMHRLEVIAQGTDKTRLLLNNAHEQKLDTFDVIYNWIKDSLIIIHPTSEFSRLLIFSSDEIIELYNYWLPNLDMGIMRVEKEETTAQKIGLADDELEHVLDIISKNEEGKEANASYFTRDDFVLIKIDSDGKVELYRLITIHEDSTGREVPFMMNEESDGTKRVLDLIPAFCRKLDQNTTYIIDEVNRSLHSELTKALFLNFHDRCGEGNQDQIIVTTHDLELMTQKIFRRDEMWFFARDYSGSTLTSFADFVDTKKDKDIRKSYLDGRMGGLPNLRLDQINPIACGG